jgi:hypothetical protein
LDAKINTGGTGSLSVQNMEANGPYQITDIIIGNATAFGTTANFSAGEIKTITISSGIPTCTSGAIYDLAVNITYTTPTGITGVKQYGAKNLIGRCT